MHTSIDTDFLKQKAKHNDNEFVIEVAVQFFRVKITPAGESTEEIMSFCKGFNFQLLLIIFNHGVPCFLYS